LSPASVIVHLVVYLGSRTAAVGTLGIMDTSKVNALLKPSGMVEGLRRGVEVLDEAAI